MRPRPSVFPFSRTPDRLVLLGANPTLFIIVPAGKKYMKKSITSAAGKCFTCRMTQCGARRPFNGVRPSPWQWLLPFALTDVASSACGFILRTCTQMRGCPFHWVIFAMFLAAVLWVPSWVDVKSFSFYFVSCSSSARCRTPGVRRTNWTRRACFCQQRLFIFVSRIRLSICLYMSFIYL